MKIKNILITSYKINIIISIISFSIISLNAKDTVKISSTEQLYWELKNYQGVPVVFELSPGEYYLDQQIRLSSNQSIIGFSSHNTILNFQLDNPQHCILISGKRSAELEKVEFVKEGNNSKINIAENELEKSNLIELYDDDSDKVTSDWAIGSVSLITEMDDQGNIDEIPGSFRTDFDNTTLKLRYIYPIENVEVSNLRIVNNTKTDNQTSNIYINNAVNCNVSCVESKLSNFAHITLVRSENCSVSGSFFEEGHDYGGGGKAYGVAVQFGSNENLIVDNIFKKLRHSILLQAGAYNNSITFNYSIEPYWTDVSLPQDAAGDIALHGNWVHRNNFVGNIVQNIVIDDSHGKNGPKNYFANNRAENYGLFMNFSPATDSIIFIYNEIISEETLKGLYLTFGAGHILGYNYVKGELEDTLNKTEINDIYQKQSKYILGQEYYVNSKIGYPREYESGSILAKKRWESGEKVSCETILSDLKERCDNSNNYSTKVFVYDITGRFIDVFETYNDAITNLELGFYILKIGRSYKKVILK